MGYLGEDIKKLGFGLMRLPQKDGVIDVEQTTVLWKRVLLTLIRHGLMQVRKMRSGRH